MRWGRTIFVWAVSNAAWGIFWVCGATAVTALVGYVADLDGWWELAFVVGVFGLAFSALYGGSRVALNVMPERWVRREKPQEAGGFTAGLLGMAAVEERKKLRAAMQRVMGEIAYGRKMVQDANTSGFYWNASLRAIPNVAWVEHSQVLAESPDALDAYQAAEAAYHEFDRINHAVGALPIPRDTLPHVRQQDRLGDAIGAAVVAETKLRDTMKTI